jgi:hypothetical protein
LTIDSNPRTSIPNPAFHAGGRNVTADLLKGMAVLLMIQVHVMEQFGTTDAYNSVIGKVSLFAGGPPCAPVFLAVMGFFLASSSRPTHYFIRRGLLLFFGGILLNSGRSVHLLWLAWQGQITIDPLFYILGVDILPLAGLALIFTGLFRSVIRDRWIVWLLLTLGVASSGPWLPEATSELHFSAYVLAFFWDTGGQSYFPVFPWLAYVTTGYSLRLLLGQPKIKEWLERSVNLFILIGGVLILLITLPWASSVTHRLTGPGGYYHHGIVFFLWTTLFMAVYAGIIHSVSGHFQQSWFGSAIQWLGRKVTLVYVIQWLIIGNLAPLLYQSQHVFQLILWYGSVTAVTALLSLAWLKIRGQFSEFHPWRSGLH